MSASPSVFLNRVQRSRDRLQVLVLVLLAYVPALTSAPGKLPADTKLYLYLNPARLTGDAPYSWDSRQFAGWVPHQTLSYLWPSGPWYSLCNAVGVPDWVAHRLWIGTLLFAAGLGVRWAAKLLGIPATGALIAAMFYQLSPYVLPYISRTSAMLLPWAGLGWLIGLTIRAATRSKWRDVGLFGLVMATVAAPNATAIVMIAPGPVLWLLHAAWGRMITWRRAATVAAKLGAISVAMSAWWIAMLSVQGRYGADVLGYSETLQAVSFTSSSAEVLRGMGYWLFYIRDPVGFATTASFRYMSSGRLIAISFIVLAVSLLGLVVARWSSRRYAALLVFVGVVLAVGVHPIGNSSPLMSPLANNSRSALSLAMRSSTRALPLSTLGLALGAGALVASIARSRMRLRRLAPWLVGALALVNLPALFDGGLVDPALTHDEHPPAAWTQAAAVLDATAADHRVLQIPGNEFGAFRWGYTVDPPLPGLTTKAFISRDLLPLGSPAAMDTIYALDDRFQEGTAEIASVAPIARLFGVDTIWLPNDVAFERFRSPRPETISEMFSVAGPTAGLGPLVTYGSPQVNTPVLPMVDEQSISNHTIGTPLAPVALVQVSNPQPIIRAKTGTVMVAGSGDGLVDAAAAGLITGNELIRYSADMDPTATADGNDAATAAERVIITDSNRDRAHQWRGSQDVTGFTEDGTPDGGVLRFDSADQRLPLFASSTTADMTIAEQRGAVHAAASAYGEPFAYRPEDRAVHAVDGDPTTAWIVADHGEPTGEFLRLTSSTPMTTLTLVQPQDLRNRWITAITVTDASGSFDVDLTAASRGTSGQQLRLRSPSTTVTITIAATAHAALFPGEGLDGVGFAEVSAGLGRTDEIVRVPSAGVGAAQRLDIVLTRLRTRPTNRYRSDPEPSLARSFTLQEPRTADVSMSARIDQRADDATIADLFGWAGTTSTRRLTGVPAMGGWAATDANTGTAWVSPFGQAIGSELDIPLDSARTTTSLVLRQPVSDQLATITEIEISGSGSGSQTVAVPTPDADGISTVEFAGVAGAQLHIRITATNDAFTIDRRYGQPVRLPVGIAEVSAPGIVASTLQVQLDTGCRSDMLTIDGVGVPARITGETAELFTDHDATVSLCDPSTVSLGDGEHLVRSAAGLLTGIDINRVVLTSAAASAPGTPTSPAAAAPTVTITQTDRTSRSLSVASCTNGCWLVFGEGFNPGWAAALDGVSLGAQQPVDGGFNGWWLPPATGTRAVELTWQGQGTVNMGLLLAALALLVCLGLVVYDRSRTDAPILSQPAFAALWGKPTLPALRSWRSLGGPPVAPVAIATIAGALVIAPAWGLICGLVAFVCCVVLRRVQLMGLVAIGIVATIGLVMVYRVVTTHPFANAGWPMVFDDLHRPGMAVVVLLVAGLSTARHSADAESR